MDRHRDKTKVHDMTSMKKALREFFPKQNKSNAKKRTTGDVKNKRQNESIEKTKQERPHSTFINLFNSALKEYSPHQIRGMYNVLSTCTAEIVVYHTENMANLIGIGLPFAKVSVAMKPRLKFEIKDMSKQEWDNLWMESYEGTFKRMIFRKTHTLNFRARGLGWVDELERKALADSEKKKKGRNDIVAVDELESSTKDTGGAAGGWSSGESEISSTSERYKLEVAKKEEAKSDTVEKRTVHVQMSGRQYKLSGIPYNSSTQQNQELQENDVPIPGPSFIKPTLAVEFVCGPNFGGGCSKRLNVIFRTEYQFGDSNVDSHPRDSEVDGEHSFKSGWYHNNLLLSFNCSESGAARRDISSQAIVSKLKTLELESTNNSQNSEADREATDSSKPFAGPNLSSKGQTREGVASLNQAEQKFSVQVLAEATSFYINSFCTEHEMAYRASLLRDTPRLMGPCEDIELDKDKIGGKFSSVSPEVKGSWRLLGDNNVRYTFKAQRELLHPNLSSIRPRKTKFMKFDRPLKKNSNKYVEKSPISPLLQKVSHEFILNHSFSHMNMKSRNENHDLDWEIEWVDP